MSLALLAMIPYLSMGWSAVSVQWKWPDQVRSKLDADVGISFTGVAGLDEQEGKPVGNMYLLAFHRDGNTHFKELNFSGSRAQNRIRV